MRRRTPHCGGVVAFYVADAHCDYLFGAVQSGFDLLEPKRGQVITMERLRSGHVAMQVFAMWIDTSLRASPLHQCIAMIDAYNHMLERHPQLVPFTKDYVPTPGMTATVLAIEGGEAIEGSLAALRMLYKLGVRVIGLCWNENNELTGAAMANGNRGLTPLGREVVEEMCRLGIAIDVSHASDRAVDDLLKYSARPLFASHSNARAVYNSPRSLLDEHIRAIAAEGGVIGVNFFHQQLCGNGTARIQDIVRQIQHIVDVGGPYACALGSDFDGMTRYPHDLKNSGDFPKLGCALQMAGFSDEQIHRIFYANLRNYMARFI